MKKKELRIREIYKCFMEQYVKPIPTDIKECFKKYDEIMENLDYLYINQENFIK